DQGSRRQLKSPPMCWQTKRFNTACLLANDTSNVAEVHVPEHEQPDPKGRITRDTRKLITVETAVVPPTRATGGSARVHVEFRPNVRLKAHWNNEAGPLVLWVNPPPGWQTNGNDFSVRNPPEPVSLETRRVEFELKPPDEEPGIHSVSAYALYYVC